MLKKFFAVLICILMIVACRQLPIERPQDFSLTLEWNTGSLPPQYTYMYVINLGPGLEGELDYRPGYDPNNTSQQWVTSFSVKEKQMEELFAYLQSQDMFRSKWKQGEVMEGSPGTNLILHADGQEFHVPSISELDRNEFVLVDNAIEAIRALVPKTIWDEMDARQMEYETNFEE
jgi:hypothetical protein